MRIFTVSSVVATLAAVAACGLRDTAMPTDQNGSAAGVAAGVSAAATAKLPEAKNFKAHLSGAEEVPARDTRARGQLKMKLSKDGLSLEYELKVKHIENVVASHIHLGAVGVNGGVVVFLFGPAAPGGGPLHGTIARGTITGANLINALAGHPLSDLVAQMEAGNAYANVHTNDGVGATNTGPGDFPGGEIRGQVRVDGPTP